MNDNISSVIFPPFSTLHSGEVMRVYDDGVEASACVY